MAPGIARECARTGIGGQGKHHIPASGDEGWVFACTCIIYLVYFITITYVYAVRAIKKRPAVDGEAFDNGVGR